MKSKFYNFKANRSCWFVLLAMTGLLTLNACEKDDETSPEIEDPITLDCNYFRNNSNVTLTDNPNAPVDYIIGCIVNIEDDLTIEPGVTIAFSGDGTGIRIRGNGSITAVGTADLPITFTGTQQQAGWWDGIDIASDNRKNKISHAIIEYGGGVSDAAGIGGGVAGRANLLLQTNAVLELTHTTLRHSGDAGFATARGGNYPSIMDFITFENNTYTDNVLPIRLADYLVGNLGRNDTYIGNQIDKIEVTGSRSGTGTGFGDIDIVWKNLGLPYWVNGDLQVGGATSDQTRLTIEPGTIMEMDGGRNINIASGYNALVAVGTEAEPIIIRGADPTPGSWGEIRYNMNLTSPHNDMQHVHISHAGGNTNTNQVVYLYTSNTKFDHIHFSEIRPASCSIGRTSNNVEPNIANITRDVASTGSNCWY